MQEMSEVEEEQGVEAGVGAVVGAVAGAGGLIGAAEEGRKERGMNKAALSIAELGESFSISSECVL